MLDAVCVVAAAARRPALPTHSPTTHAAWSRGRTGWVAPCLVLFPSTQPGCLGRGDGRDRSRDSDGTDRLYPLLRQWARAQVSPLFVRVGDRAGCLSHRRRASGRMGREWSCPTPWRRRRRHNNGFRGPAQLDPETVALHGRGAAQLSWSFFGLFLCERERKASAESGIHSVIGLCSRAQAAPTAGRGASWHVD